MSYPIVFKWPAPDTQAISLTQSLAGAGHLLINGTLTINNINPGEVVFPGISRVVSLTSTNNLSGVNFTISGILNGSAVSVVIAGPNNNTVQTTQLFDQVLSVSTNGAVSAVSIGTGTTGQTHWYNYDYNRIYGQAAFQVVVGGTINYTLATTLDDVQSNANPFLSNPSAALTTKTASAYDYSLSPFNYLTFTINSSGSDGTLIATVIQQGID